MVVLFQGVRFVPSCVNGRRWRIKNDVPETPTLQQKYFPAYFIKYTEYRRKNVTGRAWLYTESAADLHLVRRAGYKRFRSLGVGV